MDDEYGSDDGSANHEPAGIAQVSPDEPGPSSMSQTLQSPAEVDEEGNCENIREIIRTVWYGFRKTLAEIEYLSSFTR